MRWNPFRARVETKAQTDEEILALLDSYVTGPHHVSREQALAVPAVLAAVKLISESVATLDIRVRRRVGDAEVDATEHPAWNLLRRSANDWTSGFELIRDLVADALTIDHGGIAWVNRVNGSPHEIVRYDPGHITFQLDPHGTGEPRYFFDGREIDRREIVHVRTGFKRCPLNMARDSIIASRAMGQYASRLFGNGVQPGGVIELKEDLAPEQIAKIRAAFIATHAGPENAGKPIVLFDGAQWKQSALSSTDAQFLENRKFQNLEIARAFRVPPGMIFEMDRQTWANGEQQGKEYLSYTLEPHLRAVETAFERALFTDEERAEYSVEFDRDDLTRADFVARMTAYSTAISARVVNPNECRVWEGLAPYEGGDEYANPHINPNTGAKAEPANQNRSVAA